MSQIIKVVTNSFTNFFKVTERVDIRRNQRAEIEDDERQCQEASRACMRLISEHLRDFIHESTNAKYEDWLHSCHPENCQRCVDHRFYVKNSDHRIIWNKIQERRHRLSLIIEPRFS